MSTNKRDLKAYVRFDGTGRIVPSSLILRRKKPKVGKWVEIQTYECCNPTTTSSTTAAPSYYSYTLGFGISSEAACSDGSPLTYYSASPTLSIGTSVYQDVALTIPIVDGYYCLTCPNSSGIGVFWVNALFGGAGKVFSTTACPS